MPIVITRKAIPTKRMPKIVAAQVSVVRAFFHSGLWNAGTPSLIASTPVRATAPWLKARRMRKRPSACPPSRRLSHAGGGAYGATLPRTSCITPKPMIPSMTTM